MPTNAGFPGFRGDSLKIWTFLQCRWKHLDLRSGGTLPLKENYLEAPNPCFQIRTIRNITTIALQFQDFAWHGWKQHGIIVEIREYMLSRMGINLGYLIRRASPFVEHMKKLQPLVNGMILPFHSATRWYHCHVPECLPLIIRTPNCKILPRCHITATVGSTPWQTSSIANLTFFLIAAISLVK
jgi:hypothetical protein